MISLALMITPSLYKMVTPGKLVQGLNEPYVLFLHLFYKSEIISKYKNIFKRHWGKFGSLFSLNSRRWGRKKGKQVEELLLNVECGRRAHIVQTTNQSSSFDSSCPIMVQWRPGRSHSLLNPFSSAHQPHFS